MKTKLLFQWIVRTLLIAIIAGSVSAVSNQTVLAKPNEHLSQESKQPALNTRRINSTFAMTLSKAWSKS